MFGSLFSDFFSIPRLPIKLFLMCPVTFNPVFNSSKNHFHKDSLRTNPTTKNPTINDSEKDDENYSENRSNSKYVEILWPKDVT